MQLDIEEKDDVTLVRVREAKLTYPVLSAFFSEVRSELKKVTWPSRQEVYSTTIVVLATTFFFGFYLWGLDLVFSQILSHVLKQR